MSEENKIVDNLEDLDMICQDHKNIIADVVAFCNGTEVEVAEEEFPAEEEKQMPFEVKAPANMTSANMPAAGAAAMNMTPANTSVVAPAAVACKDNATVTAACNELLKHSDNPSEDLDMICQDHMNITADVVAMCSGTEEPFAEEEMPPEEGMFP